MTSASFAKQLILVSIVAAVLAYVPEFFTDGWSIHNTFSWCIWGMFIAISILLYALGTMTAKSKDKYLFQGVIMGSVLIKLVAGLGALYIYQRNSVPINKLFIWVFLIHYLVFTAWEVRYMTHLAKQ